MKKYFKWLLSILVVSIIGTVVTMPNVDSHGYWLGKSKSDIKYLKNAVNEYWQDHNQLPRAAEGLISLVNNAKKNDSNQKRYLNRLQRDYWGNNYLYNIIEDGKKFEIYSAGPDAVDNEGMGDDVVIGDKQYSCELYNDCLTLRDYAYQVFFITMLISITLILLVLIYLIGAYIMGK
ncbi:MAG: type II secretion system protein GspG [Candidatus Thiodiazotropha endolucinida]